MALGHRSRGVHDEEMRRGYMLMCAAVSSALGCLAGCNGLLNTLLRPTRRRWSAHHRPACVRTNEHLWRSCHGPARCGAESAWQSAHQCRGIYRLYGLCLAANGPVPEVAVGFTECSTCDWPSARQSFRCAATALFVGAHPIPEKTKTGRRWLQWLVIIRIR